MHLVSTGRQPLKPVCDPRVFEDERTRDEPTGDVPGRGQRARWRRNASSSAALSSLVSTPTGRPTRSIATERSCSDWALESRSCPVADAGSRTWKGYTCSVFELTGTTVMTSRPRRSAEPFAPSLLTITSGRRVLASAPRTGSRSTRQISLGASASRYRSYPRVPHRRLATTLPTPPRSRVRVLRPSGGPPPCATRHGKVPCGRLWRVERDSAVGTGGAVPAGGRPDPQPPGGPTGRPHGRPFRGLACAGLAWPAPRRAPTAEVRGRVDWEGRVDPA